MINLTNIKLLKLLRIFDELAKWYTVPCSSSNVPSVVPSMPIFLRVHYFRVMISGSLYRLEYCHIDSPLYTVNSLVSDHTWCTTKWSLTGGVHLWENQENKLKLNWLMWLHKVITWQDKTQANMRMAIIFDIDWRLELLKRFTWRFCISDIALQIQFFKQGPAYKKGPDPNKGSNQQ